ncbi:hypothetical protein HYC85_001788 [Camellia sinensis]|uniref:Uncharacterized protein n=1 Tax=Camellia sinensis TaxID=4442 RepID=A0A7J7I6L6_CAMSI|nr:hypothetical protein HYC85_001788 [Camellia sinensis]
MLLAAIDEHHTGTYDFIYLPIGPISHGGITSSGMDNGTISGVHTAIQSPPFMERVFHHGISSSIPNSLPSLVRVELLGNQSGLPEPPLSPGQTKIEFQGTPNFHPYSLPEYQDDPFLHPDKVCWSKKLPSFQVVKKAFMILRMTKNERMIQLWKIEKWILPHYGIYFEDGDGDGDGNGDG